MPDREEKIRARAYALWERGGYAHGSHEEHWSEAERQIDAEEAQGAAPSAGALTGADEAAPNIGTPAAPVPSKRRPKAPSPTPGGARSPRPKGPKPA